MPQALFDEIDALLPPALKAQLTELALSRGEYLFRQGQGPRRMYLVLHGEVLLERPGESGAAVTLQRVRGGFVAEASLQAERYHCDALVAAPGAALWLPLEVLRAQLSEDGAFALRWIGMLSGEVRRLRAQCERLSFNSVSERLLHLIETEGAQGWLSLPRGLKSLAPELAVTHEALYRTAARLERDGVIRRDGCGIGLSSAVSAQRG